jgi:type VI secretion system protein ImpC
MDGTEIEPEGVPDQRRLRDEIVAALSACETAGLVSDPVRALSDNDMSVARIEGFLSTQIAAIDALLSAQLAAIVDSLEFRELEATWRGLHYLVESVGSTATVRIRVLNVSKDELREDLERSIEFDQSRLFEKVYSEALDTWGGLPFSVLIGGYEFSGDGKDLVLLQNLSHLAAAVRAPFLAAASPELFELETFRALCEVDDLSELFDTADYVRWRSFRDSEDACYVALCLPHVLLRRPSDIAGGSAALWGNAAYVVAARFARAFDESGWVTDLADGEPIDDLPVGPHVGDSPAGSGLPVDVVIREHHAEQLASLGFLAVATSTRDETQSVGIIAVPSCARGDTSDLRYTLALSRLAHLVRGMLREKDAGPQEPMLPPGHRWEELIGTWLAGYVCLDDDISPAMRARFPLRHASVAMAGDWYRRLTIEVSFHRPLDPRLVCSTTVPAWPQW